MTPKEEVQEAARRIQQALGRLGFEHENKAGGVWQISYRSLGLDRTETYALLEVDTQTLPRKVTLAKLTHPQTLHHLAAVVGKPVKLLNSVGLTYCVVLLPKTKPKLPRMVVLDLGVRPSGDYLIPIGFGLDGPVWRSLLETGHILVGGESGSGKSTWLNTLLVSLLVTHRPDQLQFALIDPKGVEFLAYHGVKHLVVDIADEVETATEVTDYLADAIETRKKLFTGVLAKSLSAYNERVDESLPLVVAIFDELTDVALAAGLDSRFYKNSIRLPSKARSFGVVLILSTQNPKAEVLNTLIRGNLSTRIAFRVPTSQHSRTILGMSGAENLPRTIKGRLLARLGDRGLAELQGFYLSETEIIAIAERAGASPFPTLTPLEQALVRHALANLDGNFPIDHLYRDFKGQISRRQLVKLASNWEKRGWLAAPFSPTESRKVTPALVRLLGEVLDTPER